MLFHHYLVLLILVSSQFTLANKFDFPERLIAIGDIHGDGFALKKILVEMKLIDKKGKWTGGKTHLVFLGDILDRGQSSRKAMDLIIDLETKAPKKGGIVTTVLGNHEMMVIKNELRYFSRKDAVNYKDFSGPNKKDLKATIKNAFAADTKYGKWIASLPAIVRIGDTAFMHAGIEDWILKNSIEEVNVLIQKWKSFFMGIAAPPPIDTKWVVEREGPLWTRKLAQDEVDEKTFSTWLEKAGLNRIVVGHTVTADFKPNFKYNEKLVMVDTGISNAMGGKLSAIEWKKGQAIQSHSFERNRYPKGKTEKDFLFNDDDGIEPKKSPPPEPSL